mmetsp:Transcript_2741/g.6652  ORF Transcript_2741/g.6652 Transcript_2741/m.6652 type:complete len:90 (-) Transcript_2741:259-528(-)
MAPVDPTPKDTEPIKERVIEVASNATHTVGDAAESLKKNLTGAPAPPETLGGRTVDLAKDVTGAVVGGVTGLFKADPAAAPDASKPTAP